MGAQNPLLNAIKMGKMNIMKCFDIIYQTKKINEYIIMDLPKIKELGLHLDRKTLNGLQMLLKYIIIYRYNAYNDRNSDDAEFTFNTILNVLQRRRFFIIGYIFDSMIKMLMGKLGFRFNLNFN